jgi:hypothetical protein
LLTRAWRQRFHFRNAHPEDAMSRYIVERPERRLIPRKIVELISGLKGGSLQRAIDRGELHQPVMFGDNTPRWWEDELYDDLSKLRRGKGKMPNSRSLKPKQLPLVEAESAENALVPNGSDSAPEDTSDVPAENVPAMTGSTEDDTI